MANYACEYVKEIDKFLMENHTAEEVKVKCSDHLIKIGFFQHERFVHLLVTVLFALMDIIAFSLFVITLDFYCSILFLLFTVLLIPYIFHYYFLENSVQKMYRQYDELNDKMK